MRSNLFGQNLEQQAAGQAFSLQNNRMLKVQLKQSEVYALRGSMVAYQGEMEFDTKFFGVEKYLKKAFTGEGLPLMVVRGTGDLFLAHMAAEVHLVYLEGESLTINGTNVLAFESSLEWDVKMVRGMGIFTESGWFNVTITGTGWVALMAHGSPVVLQPAEAPTYADFAAVVAWSTNLQTDVHHSFNWKFLIGRGSGEAWQIGFKGEGIVVIQSGEAETITPEYGAQKESETDKQG